MKHKCIIPILLILIGFMSFQLRSQTFTEVSTSILPLLGSSDWGDYDSDGDLDLIIAGSSTLSTQNTNTCIYTNLGNGQFANLAGHNVIAIHSGTAKWLDFNNDGILDIFISGLYNDAIWHQDLPVTRLYKGLGNKSFELTSNSFQAQSQTSMDWGDYNNDGNVDIAFNGYTESNPNYYGKVYENTGNAFSQSVNFTIEPFINGSLKWGDYDGDQDLDLLQTGWYWDWGTYQNKYACYIYRNDVDKFTLLNNLAIQGLVYGSSEWGDYDNDGDLDMLLSGSIDGGTTATGFFGVYRNVDNGFVKVFGSFSSFVWGRSKWGDFDNDGDLDILVTGRNQTGPMGATYLYKNDIGTFTQFTTLCDIQASTLDFVDYDKDGDLDIFLMGASNYVIQKKLFRNNASNANQKPDAPTGIKAEVNKKKVHFSWNPATDDNNNSKSLTYNISVGSLPANTNIMSPNSNLANGYRRIVRMGNTSVDTCWDLTFKSSSRYYWQIQAIDHCFAGSAFSEAGTFVIGSPVVLTEEATDIGYTGADLNGRVNPFDLNTNAFFEYGTDSTNLTVTAPIVLQGDSMYHVKTHVQNLVQNTIYYFRVKALNEIDTVNGKLFTFRTATTGIAITEAATDVSYTEADLNGKVNPFYLNTNVFFEYGTDSTFLTATTPVILHGDSMFSVKTHVQDLVQDTVYYFRIKAINTIDTVSGQFFTFRTAYDGIEEIFRDLAVYPNPGNGIFRLGVVDQIEGTIFLYDLTGRVRMQLNSKESGNPNIIDIKHLEAGIYTLVYTTGKYFYHCRIEKL